MHFCRINEFSFLHDVSGEQKMRLKNGEKKVDFLALI